MILVNYTNFIFQCQQIKPTGTTSRSFLYVLSVACVIQGLGCLLATGNLGSTKVEIVTIWPFTEKGCQLLIYIRFRGMVTSGKARRGIDGGACSRGVSNGILSLKLLMGYI